MRQLACAVLIGLGLSAGVSAQLSFEFLPSTVGSSRGLARGVSGDGQVIAGSTQIMVTEKPVVWRRVDGVWMRFDLPAEGSQGLGRAISLSHDGDVIGGMTNSFASGTAVYGTAAVWTGVLSGLPVLDSPMDSPQVRRGIFSGVSADGSMTTGYAAQVPPTSPREMWTYSAAGLAQISPASPPSYATPFMCGSVMSADGSVIVGARMDVERRLAIRWSAAGGFAELPTPTVGTFRNSMAEAVSRDGRVIGGCLTFQYQAYNTEATPALWTDAGRVDLPLIPAMGPHGRVLALSGDGRIAGGAQYTGVLLLDGSSHGSEHAVLWIDGQVHGLASYLSSRGVNMQGIQPHWITGISDDGRVLVGFAGQMGQGLRSFIVTLPPPCRVDLSGDGLADFSDYLLFLNAYESQNPAADFSGDGLIDFVDFLVFLNEYQAGCG